MTDYQTLTLKETHEELIVSTMEYPLVLAGVFYIKFIVYDKIDTDKGIFYEPIKFMTVQPQDILKRENIWTQEEEDMIKFAAKEAKDREHTMDEYRAAAEEEMAKRSKEILPPLTKTNEEDDEDIDPDFKTDINLNDPNYV